MSRINVLSARFGSILLSILVLMSSFTGLVSAATQNPTAAARVSFTFDDGYASVYSIAVPTLSKYGLTGTSYIVTHCVGMTTVPNTCGAETDKRYMTWAQVQALQNTYGWDVGSHTYNHPLLASTDASFQPVQLTPTQVEYELSQSKADLVAHGINVKSFASPYGDYNPSVLAQIARYYESHRGYADIGYNQFPNSDYILRTQQVQKATTVAAVKGYIDQAIANKTWLTLTFHDITAKSSSDTYAYTTANLDAIAAYVKQKQTAGLIQPTTVTKGLVKSDTNLLSNPSFNSGISNGWTTNNPTGVVADATNNGNYPDSLNAVKFTANATVGHLFGPRVSVNPSTTYLVKDYLSVRARTTGQVEFYVDEYDANGTWISGQYKGAEPSVWTESFNFTYKPTSAQVASSSLQVSVPANSGITAYLDNAQMFALTTDTTPVITNLITNSTFDTGITGGWTTDNSAAITADSANNGSPANPVNSVKMVSPTTSNAHLFSQKVGVTSLKSYTISSYLDLRQITSGSVGYYVDEYNASGAWISGQYLASKSAVSKSTVALTYTPSSTAVASASLQVIDTANAGIVAYFDNVVWYQN